MFIRELLALYVYNYFEMINPTCSFSLPLSFGRLKYFTIVLPKSILLVSFTSFMISELIWATRISTESTPDKTSAGSFWSLMEYTESGRKK